MRNQTSSKTTSIIYLYMYFLFVFFSCKAPGFQVVSQAQKTPQPIVPKEKSSSRKNQKASSNVGENFTQKAHHNSQPTVTSLFVSFQLTVSQDQVKAHHVGLIKSLVHSHSAAAQLW